MSLDLQLPTPAVTCLSPTPMATYQTELKGQLQPEPGAKISSQITEFLYEKTNHAGQA